MDARFEGGYRSATKSTNNGLTVAAKKPHNPQDTAIIVGSLRSPNAAVNRALITNALTMVAVRPNFATVVPSIIWPKQYKPNMVVSIIPRDDLDSPSSDSNVLLTMETGL